MRREFTVLIEFQFDFFLSQTKKHENCVNIFQFIGQFQWIYGILCDWNLFWGGNLGLWNLRWEILQIWRKFEDLYKRRFFEFNFNIQLLQRIPCSQAISNIQALLHKNLLNEIESHSFHFKTNLICIRGRIGYSIEYGFAYRIKTEWKFTFL